jgi:hypothetical protein
MHPTIGYDLAKTQITGLHHQAHRDVLAHTVRRSHRARSAQSGHRAPGLRAVVTRCMLTVLGARSP